MAERTATVQVNGGQLELIDCRVANPAGHGVVATSSWDACELVLLRSEIDCAERGLFATGQATRARINQSQLRSRSVALFAVEGAQVSMQGGRIQADSVGVELWGVEARVSLTGCHMGATPHMVRLAKGATRSQLTSEQLVFEPAQPSEPAQSGGG
ncbi:MAG: hypothetical protein DRQ55_17230 [Planctomycetota bacterium]|nr:MAG: hypothetical protein DRQ55_17230 [Planctomycetota bacterium]